MTKFILAFVITILAGSNAHAEVLPVQPIKIQPTEPAGSLQGTLSRSIQQELPVMTEADADLFMSPRRSVSKAPSLGSLLGLSNELDIEVKSQRSANPLSIFPENARASNGVQFLYRLDQ